MSFTKTISTVAALASIFGAAAAGWKLTEANSQQPPTVLDQKITELEKQIDQATAEQQTPPIAADLPAPSQMPPQPTTLPLQAPAPAVLPVAAPTPPPPPPVQNEVQ
jgi:hypothetical protein